MLGSVAPLLVGAVFLLAGNALLGTSVAVGMDEGGHGPLRTGLVVTGYFVGFGLGSLRGRRVVARVGHVRAFAGFASALGAAAIAHALVGPQVLPWLVLCVLAGFSIAGLYRVIESWMNVAGAGTSRGPELAVYMVVVHLALAAGPLLFAMPAGEDPAPTRHALATLRVCVPVGLYTVGAPELESAPSLSLRALGRVAPLGLGTALGAGALGGAVHGMGPVLARQTAVPVGGVSTFMTLVVLDGLGFQLPVGRWSDRVDRRRVLAASSVGAALVAVGAVLGAYALGSTAGPLLAAGAMQGLGGDGFPIFLATVATAISIHAVHRIRTAAPVPLAEQEPFVPATRTTSAAAELDPRTEEEEVPAEETHGFR